MEITALQLYWIIKLDTFSDLGIGFSVVFGITTFICIAATIACSIDPDLKNVLPTWKKFSKYSIPLFIFFLSMGTFLPTTKEMAVLIVLPKIINNEKVQEIPNKVLDLGLEWLEELKPTKAIDKPVN
jgi:hypothetical protein